MKLIVSSILIFLITVLNSYSQTKSFDNNNDKVSSDTITHIVYVSFFVNKKGQMNDIEIMRIEGDTTDPILVKNLEREALRLLKEAPEVKTRGKNALPTNQKIVLPMQFKMPVKKE